MKRKKKSKVPKKRNFVAKNAQRSGAGVHPPKKGKGAKQKQKWVLRWILE